MERENPTAPDPLDQETRAVADRLKAQIVQRGRTKANPCELDLRSSEWAPVGWTWKVMRWPGDPGWPDRGRTVANEKEAKSPTVLDAYAKHIAPQVKVARAASGVTVPKIEEAVTRFIEHLKETKGKRHSTPINWEAMLKAHLVRPHGKRPLTWLTRDNATNLLTNMIVNRGKSNERRANDRTRGSLRTAMTGVWRHALPAIPPPFAGVTIVTEDASAARRKAAEAGIITPSKKSAYSPPELLEILAWATYLDRRNVLGRPNVKVCVLPNTAEIIAAQTLFGTRIEELTFIRRGHIDGNLRTAFIPGTKTPTSRRPTIAFDAGWPWVEAALEHAAPGPNGYVFRTDPRANKRASTSTLGSRITRVLKCAGLKSPGQATHIFRDTMITWLTAEGLADRTIRILVGHEALPGITAKYMNAELFVQMILQLAPDIRGHLSQFPTREDVSARADELQKEEAFERWQKGG